MQTASTLSKATLCQLVSEHVAWTVGPVAGVYWVDKNHRQFAPSGPLLVSDAAGASYSTTACTTMFDGLRLKEHIVGDECDTTVPLRCLLLWPLLLISDLLALVEQMPVHTSNAVQDGTW